MAKVDHCLMMFRVTTRFENDAPKITLVESGTIAIGASVDENGDKGESRCHRCDYG